jgi:hypothetical protein
MAHRGMLGAVTPDLGALSSSARFGTDRADVMLDRRFGRSAATNRGIVQTGRIVWLGVDQRTSISSWASPISIAESPRRTVAW